MSSERKYSLTLFGATGFTGGLCARYLAAHLPEGSAWAIAGRNEEKLARLRASLQAEGVANLPDEIVADVHDPHSLGDMAAVSKVVITTVGPYVLYGEAVARACAEQGTHYCDLTGEPEFVSNLITRYHELAKANGCALVSSCGFDSIPHDAGVLFSIRTLEEQLGGKLTAPVDVEGVVTFSGSFSGGTWESALLAFSRPRQNREAMRRANMMLRHQYSRQAGSLPLRLRHDDRFRTWMCPMPTVDPMVVNRSARALEDYGPQFRYGHYIGIDNLPRLAGGAAAMGGLLLAAQLKPLRGLLTRQRPSGQGPSEQEREKSWFKVRFRARSAGHEVICQVSGGDPGYNETAKMLSETAMGLALDEGLPKRTGVVTPVMALEDRLIERLQGAGLEFSVLERH